MYSVSYDYDVVFNVATQTFDVLDPEGNDILEFDRIYETFLSDLLQYERENAAPHAVFPFKAAVQFSSHFSEQLDTVLLEAYSREARTFKEQAALKTLLLAEVCVYAGSVIIEDPSDPNFSVLFKAHAAVEAPHSTDGMLKVVDRLLSLFQSIQIKIPGAQALASFAHSLLNSTFKSRLVRDLYLAILLEIALYGRWIPRGLEQPLIGLRNLLIMRNESRAECLGIQVQDGESGC